MFGCSGVRLIWIIVVFLTLGWYALADTIAVNPVADSYISLVAPDTNSGTETTVVAGALGQMSGGDVRRSFLRFDLSNLIPQNAVVNSATLQLTVVAVPQNPQNSFFDLRRVLRTWTENDVTWNTASTGNPWEQAGGTGASDCVGAPSASAFITGLGPVSFSSAELRNNVQLWVSSPATNRGWLLVSEDESSFGTARRFSAREDPDSSNAPVLSVDYSVPAQGTPASLLTPHMSNGNFQFQLVGGAGLKYAVLASADLKNWMPLLTNTSPFVFIDTNRVPMRFYRARFVP